MYVYIESEHHATGSLWTVGFYDPSGKWIPESDHDTKEKASARVHYLNGGNPQMVGMLKHKSRPNKTRRR